jgi:hypothetical protein
MLFIPKAILVFICLKIPNKSLLGVSLVSWAVTIDLRGLKKNLHVIIINVSVSAIFIEKISLQFNIFIGRIKYSQYN